MNPSIIRHNGVEVSEAQKALIEKLLAARTAGRPVTVNGYVNSDGDIKNIAFAWSSWEAKLVDIREARKALIHAELPALFAEVSGNLGIEQGYVAEARLAVLAEWDAELTQAANPTSGSVPMRGPVYLSVESSWAFVIPGKPEKLYIRNIVLTHNELIHPGKVTNSRPLTKAKDALRKKFLPREYPFQLGLLVAGDIKA